MTNQPVIVSFVLRLYQITGEGVDPENGRWRVSARHVQTGEEAQFTDLTEAFGLIQRWADEAAADGAATR